MPRIDAVMWRWNIWIAFQVHDDHSYSRVRIGLSKNAAVNRTERAGMYE